MTTHDARRHATRMVLAAGLVIAIGIAAFGAPAAGGGGECSFNPQLQALDFWAGVWGNAGMRSVVRFDPVQCLVVERRDDGAGHRGRSYFGYSSADRAWHGMFADNLGRVHVFFDGQVADGAATFTGPAQPGMRAIDRLRVRRIGPDAVEQVWEQSRDGGATWTRASREAYVRLAGLHWQPLALQRRTEVAGLQVPMLASLQAGAKHWMAQSRQLIATLRCYLSLV